MHFIYRMCQKAGKYCIFNQTKLKGKKTINENEFHRLDIFCPISIIIGKIFKLSDNIYQNWIKFKLNSTVIHT